jgi:RNA polymerase sigma-70 factor (ECF subfamily)
VFLARLGRRAEDVGRSVDSIEAALRALDAAGRSAWPEVPLQAQAFAVHIADRVRAQRNVNDALSGLHAADLFLACACSRGVPAALAAFERTHLARVHGFVGRIDSSLAFADEVAQSIREQLLVAERGGESRIANYSGRGPLSSWLRIIAIRTALRIQRDRTGSTLPAEREMETGLRSAVDPELDYLKLRYRGAYQEALEAGLASLPDRDALLLKLHYLDGLNIDRIGALYGMHRSTVARWRANVRRRVLESTREQLHRRLSLSESEFDSLLAVVRSQLIVSLRSALARPASR